MSGRRGAALACLVLAACFLVTFVVAPWDDVSVNDLPLYGADASAFLDGRLPYAGQEFEYPPLAAPVIALPGVFGSGGGYEVPFAVLMLAFGVACLLLTRRLAQLSGGNAQIALGALALSPLLTGGLIRTHFDLAPVALLLAALALIAGERTLAGFAVLGAAAQMKGFPIVAAPVALAWVWAREGRRAAFRGATALAAAIVVLAVVAVSISPSGSLDALRYQTDRPTELESSAASVLLAVGDLGGRPPQVVVSHKSAAIVHPGAGPVTLGFEIAGALAIVAAMLLAARRPDPRRLLLGSFAAVAAYTAFGKVLSPQYLVWTLPLLALALAWRRWALAATVAAATVLTFVEFPSHYLGVVLEQTFPVWLVVVRNALLLAAVALTLTSMRVTRRRVNPVPRRAAALSRAAAS